MVLLENNVINQIANICFDHNDSGQKGLHNYLIYNIVKYLKSEGYNVIREYEIIRDHSEVRNNYGYKKFVANGYIDLYAYGKEKIAIEFDTGNHLKYNSIEKLFESDSNIKIGIIGDNSRRYLLPSNLTRIKKVSDLFDFDENISLIFIGSKKIIYNSTNNQLQFNNYINKIELTHNSPEIVQNTKRSYWSFQKVKKNGTGIKLVSFMPTIKLNKNNSFMYKTKEKFVKAYNLWSEEEDEQLIREYNEGKSISEIVNSHQRNYGAIRSRIRKLGLIN